MSRLYSISAGATFYAYGKLCHVTAVHMGGFYYFDGEHTAFIDQRSFSLAVDTGRMSLPEDWIDKFVASYSEAACGE